MKIVIPDDYQDAVRKLDCFGKLAAHAVTIYNNTVEDLDALVERFQEAEGLVLIRERTTISEELLAHLPNLKLISQTGRGVNHIDLEACNRHGVVVSAGGGSPYATAELTWGLVLAAARRLPQEIEQLKAGRWQTGLGFGLHGRTLGIFGYGQIGSLVAGYGRTFGMRVIIWGREGSLSHAQADGFETASDQRNLFEQSDVLSLHLKLTPQTRGIIQESDLIHMKPTALLVNTSRAGLIESGALLRALQQGKPGLAALDVYDDEPIEADNPFLKLDNVICTPHLGYVEKDSYELYFGIALEQVNAFAFGQPINVNNPAVLPGSESQ